MKLRLATNADADALCGVLNPIIARGGTTAYQTAFTRERMTEHYVLRPTMIACTVAEDESGVLGFQSLAWAGPEDDLPEGWGVIATFARLDSAGKGVGSALFEETKRRAREAGVRTIDATIRSYNTGGLAYYAKMGFTDWKVTPEAVSKRFDL